LKYYESQTVNLQVLRTISFCSKVEKMLDKALNRLQTDSHLLVSCKAKRASEKVRSA
jgi:hypothetical protein